MNILTKQSNSCHYFAIQLPVIDEGWSIFPNNYLQNNHIQCHGIYIGVKKIQLYVRK